MSVKLPDEVRPVMESGVPVVLVTCSADGEPNVEIEAIASATGMSGIFKLRSADIYRLTSVECVPALPT